MNNLHGSLQAFKAKRQAAIPAMLVEDEIDVLIKMYAAIGPEDEELKHQFSRRWDKLPEAKRVQLVKRLLKDGLLPPIIRDALEIFSGKVVSLI